MNKESVDVGAYNELKKLASYYMSSERKGHTLSPTALVNEAYLKYNAASQHGTQLEFKAVAARNMRQILVNHAVARKAQKRGGDSTTVIVPEDSLGSPDTPIDILALDRALLKLEQVDAIKAKVVDLRYFAGYTNDEIAVELDISLASVKRKWTAARAWLFREMSK